MRAANPYDAARMGSGNWNAWKAPVDELWEAAEDWRGSLGGVEYPWLCWNVSSEWSLLQQRLVAAVGWTPVVGWDPRVGPPPLVCGAVAVDFNHRFQFPVLKPHFVLEWVYRIAPRLAFWHSDLLCRLETLEQLAADFRALPDGTTAAVPDLGPLGGIFSPRRRRYWELIGCTTAGASEAQFTAGTGWWRHFGDHPMCTDPSERRLRSRYHYEFGVGIHYWKRRYGGRVVDIPLSLVAEGHCTSIGRPDYRRQTDKNALRNMSADLNCNFDLASEATRLGLGDFLR